MILLLTNGNVSIDLKLALRDSCNLLFSPASRYRGIPLSRQRLP